MLVFSSRTDGKWIAPAPPPQSGENEGAATLLEDRAIAEAKRALSDIVRCSNLIVLSGLGTSLCVPAAEVGGPKAPTMSDLWSAAESAQNMPTPPGAKPRRSFSEILQLIGYSSERKDIEAMLSRCRLAEAFLSGGDREEVSRFIEATESIIVDSTNFVKINHPLLVHSEFLRRIARRPKRKARAKIFTTNYDLCFEEAGRQGRYIVVDGFSHTWPPTFDAVHFTYETARRVGDSEALDPIPNVFHLYKLHGSIDWSRQEDSGEIMKWVNEGKPLLIYPRNSKYELAFEQPYLEMISAFQSALRQPDTGLLVVGFGFNDNHIAEPIMSAVRSNLAMKTVVVSPRLAPWSNADGEGPGECVSNKHLEKLHKLVGAGDARISMIHCEFEQMVSMIPDMVAETDLEQHVARLRSIGAP